MFPLGSPMNRTAENLSKQLSVSPSTPTTCDATYSSQLSLETNPPIDPFNRDAIGRRSMSEKHHAALDAKETGTYQRNKKLREERERRTRGGAASLGSMESLTNLGTSRTKATNDLSHEALDSVGDLGPSLGLKKSSSLESLQTVLQEIQMSDEPRGPKSLRTPRGRGREEFVRAEVERRKLPHFVNLPVISTRMVTNESFSITQSLASTGYWRIIQLQMTPKVASSIAMVHSKVH